LNQTIQQNGLTIATVAKEVAQLKVQQNQPNSTIQTAQQDIEGVANEMALPKEQQQQKETIKSTHLIKVGLFINYYNIINFHFYTNIKF
jgi:hypothetical protein